MKKPESSIAKAWRARGAATGAAQTRVDLVLPHGWPETLEPIQWRAQRRGAAAQSGEVFELDKLPAAVRAAPALVWTPAADTVLTQATLPTRSQRKIMQALPYALEDRLIGDPEQLHFAWREEADGSLSVAVTARARLQSWLDRLAQAGIRPIALAPSTLLVPWAVDCWSAAFIGKELLVRSGALSGFVCPPAAEAPPALLLASVQEAARQPNPPACLVVFNAPPNFPAEAWGQVLGLTVRLESVSPWDRQADARPPLNLLQGQYAQDSPVGESLKPFRIAMVLLGLWLISSLAFDLSDWWALRRQHAALQKEMTTILLSSFPETKTVLDPAAQMKRSVDALLARSGKGGRELVPLLAKTASALRSDPRVRLRSLRYADQALTLELSFPSAASPEALKGTLESAGLRAEVLALTPRAGEVDGRIRLQPAGAGPRPGT